jgi:predicted DCC family thiol-disulfide oxidoreductase YuxK
MSQTKPILLYNDECGVCRMIAKWVIKRAITQSGEATLTVQPIGEDPTALKLLSPNLSIWDAYATIHLLMPDGKLKLGGEAVAEVLRNIPRTRWFISTSLESSLRGSRGYQTRVWLRELRNTGTNRQIFPQTCPNTDWKPSCRACVAKLFSQAVA